MTDRDAFLRAIAASPDDDAPRLVFADWLDDHGDHARAEFIRVQCARAGLTEADDAFWTLGDRDLALREAHGDAWRAGYPNEWRASTHFYRGFVSEVCAETSDSRAGNMPPCETLLISVRASGREWRRWAEFPLLARCRDLFLTTHSPLPNDWPAVVAAPHAAFTGFTVCGLGALRTLDPLLACPALARLRRLNLSSASCEGDPTRLADSPHFAGLRELQTPYRANAGFMQPLFASRQLLALESLRVCFVADRDALTPALAGSLALPSLAELEVSDAWIGPGTAAALAGCPSAAVLRKLKLRESGLDSAGLTALATSRRLAGLLELTLPTNDIGSPGLATLASATFAAGLRRLDLSGNFIDANGAAALASADLPALRVLRLADTRLGPDGLAALIRAPWLPGLAVLDLGQANLDDDAAFALADVPFARLRCLTLSENADLTDAGIAALMRASWLPGLRRLDLTHTLAGDATFRAVAASPALVGLWQLFVSVAEVEPAAAALRERFGQRVQFCR